MQIFIISHLLSQPIYIPSNIYTKSNSINKKKIKSKVIISILFRCFVLSIQPQLIAQTKIVFFFFFNSSSKILALQTQKLCLEMRFCVSLVWLYPNHVTYCIVQNILKNIKPKISVLFKNKTNEELRKKMYFERP